MNDQGIEISVDEALQLMQGAKNEMVSELDQTAIIVAQQAQDDIESTITQAEIAGIEFGLSDI